MQVMPGADIAAHAQKLEAEAKSRKYCDVMPILIAGLYSSAFTLVLPLRPGADCDESSAFRQSSHAHISDLGSGGDEARLRLGRAYIALSAD